MVSRAAKPCGFSGRGKPAAAERGNFGCIPSEAGQGISEREIPSRCENSPGVSHYWQAVSRPCSSVVLWGDRVSAPCDKHPAFPWPAAPCEGPRVKIHGRNPIRPRRAGPWAAHGPGEPLGKPGVSRTSAVAPRPGIFSGAGAGRKVPLWSCSICGKPCYLAGRSGAVGWRRGPVSHRPYLLPTGCLPRLRARDSGLSTVSLRRFLLKERDCPKKATSELHLFLLRVNNFVYFVIFRSLRNYCMRRRKLYVLQVGVGGDKEDRILPTLVRIFYSQTMPRSDIIQGRLERSPQ